jgi:hypothetical protein
MLVILTYQTTYAFTDTHEPNGLTGKRVHLYSLRLRFTITLSISQEPEQLENKPPAKSIETINEINLGISNAIESVSTLRTSKSYDKIT